MTVKEMVASYLRQNGFDGLCSDDCGCGLDHLFPCECETMWLGCVPAYKHRNTTGGGAYDKFIPTEWYSTRKPK